MEILDLLTQLIDRYGYIIVTLAIMVESAGVPMPGETALIIAAAFAGAGHLNISIVIICAAAGAIIGDAGGYWAGRRLGRPFIEKHGKWFHLTPARMAKLENLFIRHGALTVFFGRFFSLLRTYAALFAGVWLMPYPTFTLYNALGGIVWALCFGMVGYLFGQNLEMLQRIAHTVGWALTIPLILIIIFAFFWHLTVKHQAALKKRVFDIIEKSFIGRFRKKFSWHIHWFLRHWTAAQYTVIHIGTGLLITSAGIYAFVKVAKSAFSDALISLWDRQVFLLFQSWATPFSTIVFRTIFSIGSFAAILTAVLGFFYFITRKKWLHSLSVCIVVLGGQILVIVLKIAFANHRSFADNPDLISGIISFPSGYVMQSLIILGLFAYYFIIRINDWVAATGIVFLTIFIVFLIGFSRLYLGVNYLSDVICGVFGGVVWLSSCITAMELQRRGQIGDRRRDKRVLRTKTQVIKAIEVPTDPK
jgi:membrane protein DedA with SNARE-associated domain/membrane-associated phospholipid phosphatase